MDAVLRSISAWCSEELLGAGVGRLFNIGKQPINVNTQVFYNVERPDNGAKWQWRFQFQLLFPK